MLSTQGRTPLRTAKPPRRRARTPAWIPRAGSPPARAPPPQRGAELVQLANAERTRGRQVGEPTCGDRHEGQDELAPEAMPGGQQSNEPALGGPGRHGERSRGEHDLPELP